MYRGSLLGSGVGLLVWVVALPVLAVVVRPGSTLPLEAPPPDDPGFRHVGTIGGLSAVYIGGGWVLTANHCVRSPDPVFVLGGVPYRSAPGSKLQLLTLPETPADLAVFRLEAPPALPWLRIARRPARPGESVTLVGNGWTPAVAELHLDGEFREAPPARALHAGLRRGGPSVLRWGRNDVTWSDRLLEIGSNHTHSFQVRFDRTGGPAEESTAVTGDSGGAAFVQRDGVWALLGIMLARTTQQGQPADVVLYGNSTQIADLSHYREQIEDITRASDAMRHALVAALIAVGGLVLWRLVSARRRRHSDA